MFVLVGPRVGLIVGLYEFGIGLLVCVGFNYKWLVIWFSSRRDGPK